MTKDFTIADLKLSERTARGLRSVGATNIQDCLNLLAGTYSIPGPERFSPLRRRDNPEDLPVIDLIRRFGPQGKDELIRALRDLGLDMSKMNGVCHGCGGSVPLKSVRKHLKDYCNACHRVLLCSAETQSLIQVALDICHEKNLFVRFSRTSGGLISAVTTELNKE